VGPGRAGPRKAPAPRRGPVAACALLCPHLSSVCFAPSFPLAFIPPLFNPLVSQLIFYSPPCRCRLLREGAAADDCRVTPLVCRVRVNLIAPAPSSLAPRTPHPAPRRYQTIEAAVFDLLTSQNDRHAQNIFIDNDGSMRLIDNEVRSFSGTWQLAQWRVGGRMECGTRGAGRVGVSGSSVLGVCLPSWKCVLGGPLVLPLPCTQVIEASPLQ
jgi:hypothetical protein